MDITFVQEVLAPREMEFYDKEWTYMGTKEELKTSIKDITGFNEHYLTGEDDFRQACIALSWMVGRTTTREEDIAYSMVGLFGITMTPFYGEGLRAFARLQEILLSSSAMDESLFAWKMPTAVAGDPNDVSSHRWRSDKWGLLAPSPEWFAGSANVRTFVYLPPRRGLFKKELDGVIAPVGRSPFTHKVALWYLTAVTGMMLGILPGLLPYVYVRHLVKKISNEEYAFKLNCSEADAAGKYERVEIYLRPIKEVDELHHFTMFSSITHYVRIRCTEFGRGSKDITHLTEGFVPQPPSAQSF